LVEAVARDRDCSGPAFAEVQLTAKIAYNGFKTLYVQFTQKNAKRLKGTVRGGIGNCPVNGKDTYCTQTSDYTFDAPMLP
jgi:hypothetical protein